MKMKTRVCLAIVVTVLLSLLAVPALAQEADTPMWVSHARLAYTGRSTSGTDTIVALVHVRDANRRKVVGALVYATWVLPDGTYSYPFAYTSYNGVAQFSTWEGKGTYQLLIRDVLKENWVYYPTVVAAYPLTAR